MNIKGVGITMLLLLSGIIGADQDHKKKKRYDYIIVGGGAAGCIAARKLSDDHHVSVLLLEAGSNRLSDPVILNPNWLANANALIFNPLYSINYTMEDPSGFLSSNNYSEGRTLGGGAAHNFLLAVRGTPRIYDSWVTTSGNANWSYNGNVLPLMKNLETYTPNGTVANPAQRGSTGPISLLQNPPIVPVVGDFLSELSAVTNAPFIADYNDPSLGDIGISAIQQFITPAPDSHRSFSGLDYLADVIDANGKGLHGRKLTVLTNAKALDFRINDSMRATSVHYSCTDSGDDNDPLVLKASLTKHTGTLILTAGSVQTPVLLMRSGVGPAAELNAAGIPVVVDSPNVGQNLQNQYGGSAIVTGTVPFEAEAFLDGYPYMANDGVRRLQAINIPLGSIFQSLLSISDPQSVGSISVVSNDPFIDPLLSFAPFSDGSVTTPGSDAYLQVSFYKMIKAAANASGQVVIYPQADHYPAPFGPAPDDLLLLADAKNDLTLQAHIVGTARMGTNISNGVVEGDLNVFGLENVKVADNSIQPLSTDGNTCYPAYIIALVLCQTLGVPTPPAL